jgi:hypothetical protein
VISCQVAAATPLQSFYNPAVTRSSDRTWSLISVADKSNLSARTEVETVANPAASVISSRKSNFIYKDLLPEQRFELLISQWHNERGATSSVTEMAMCPSYQAIIAAGPRVIPFILRKLEAEGDEPDMWFWALRVLTGEDPVLEEDRGDFEQMAKSWLTWAGSRYVW